MKFLIISDLHGQKPNIHYKNFDAIIAPGDFCSDEPKKVMFQAIRERLQNPKCKKQWYDIVGKKEAQRMVQKSLADGRIILEYLNELRIPIYTVPGNWDWQKEREPAWKWKYLQQDHYTELIRGLNNIVDSHHKIIAVKEYQIIGHGITSEPEYPQYPEDIKHLKNEKKLEKVRKEYKQQKKKLESLFKKATKPVIFLTHNVPFNTPLDIIKNPASPRNGQHYGSLIAREMIDKYQPLVCIGGHMHENFGKCTVGKTLCINAGSGSNVNIWMEMEGNKIRKLEFYRGD